ncbi:MAG: YeeE/YedE family protein [Halorubrum sp.]
MSGAGVVADHESHPLFMPLVFLGGAVFGVGLAVSQMARPEIVLEFLQFRDFGLAFVMGGASVVVGVTFWGLTLSGKSAPLTGKRFTRRVKSMDRDVIVGGGVFGVGWGLSGICPGAAYASLGIGNVVILYGVVGMFVGAYVQGYLRESRADTPTAATAD